MRIYQTFLNDEKVFAVQSENELEQKIFEVMCQASSIQVKQTKGQKKIKFKLEFPQQTSKVNNHPMDCFCNDCYAIGALARRLSKS